MQNPREMHIVRFALIVLFSALMVVYLLLYQIKGDEIAKELSGIDSWIQSEDVENTGEEQELYPEGDEEIMFSTGEESNDEQSSWTLSLTSKSLFSSLTWTTQVASWTKTTTWTKLKNGINVLSGTSLYYGTVEAIEKLWMSYQYALKDQKGILYAYLWTGTYSDIDTIVRKLWWTTFKMTTEQELMQNKLFGDKVVFINLPEYKDKKVIMLIYIDDEVWFLQIDYTVYHTSKSHIKKTFTE